VYRFIAIIAAFAAMPLSYDWLAGHQVPALPALLVSGILLPILAGYLADVIEQRRTGQRLA
jgi:hypothetical protein